MLVIFTSLTIGILALSYYYVAPWNAYKFGRVEIDNLDITTKSNLTVS